MPADVLRNIPDEFPDSASIDPQAGIMEAVKPRLSTVALVVVWLALFVLYVCVH